MSLIALTVYSASSSHSSPVWLRKRKGNSLLLPPGCSNTHVDWLPYFVCLFFFFSYVRGKEKMQCPTTIDYLVSYVQAILPGVLLTCQGNWFFPSIQQLWDHRWSSVSRFGFPVQERCWQSRWSPLEGQWDGQRLEQTYTGKWKWSPLFSVEKQRLRGDIIAIFRYVKWDYKEDRDRFFSGVHSERTRSNGHKL